MNGFKSAKSKLWAVNLNQIQNHRFLYQSTGLKHAHRNTVFTLWGYPWQHSPMTGRSPASWRMLRIHSWHHLPLSQATKQVFRRVLASEAEVPIESILPLTRENISIYVTVQLIQNVRDLHTARPPKKSTQTTLIVKDMAMFYTAYTKSQVKTNK